ncbi:MAG: type II toxin-antitoxin system YafQ family toxin [Deltaproteobacteria bacterium]|nr:type II toxin-antitoxin system YafQ family toxin [Deltaproteobacteria bacterium]
MREIIDQSQFRKDLKRVKRSGRYRFEDLLEAVRRLAADQPLESKHHVHALSGEWAHHWECHLRPDWLLIYKLEPGRLILVRTGSHSDLFG